MKDEIKEILEALKPHDEEFTKAGIKEYPLVLSIKEQKMLLDYITNLQKSQETLIKNDNKIITNLKEENDYLKDIVSNTELSDEIKKADKWSKRELYKINYQRLQVNKRLIEENERLKNRNEFIEKVCVGFDDKYKDYKSRNEKAVEKLKFYRGKLINTYVIGYADIEELLNILQGSDKDVK